ncbi:MAG: hypothetical protein M3442_09330 [Chloroflexota bacterium]|nr:hypothetical protein [Chloroflexota bacterium]
MPPSLVPSRSLLPFIAAARFLDRPSPACPVHRVRHTGKLARSVVLDLSLLDATGDTGYWTQAVCRAEEVADRLVPDPEHGALIYLPGRLDPRNCSNSVIDSGECTDSLARLLLHPHAAGLSAAQLAPIASAVRGNAGTYLCRSAAEKEITNQRLWGAMGLASAYRLFPEVAWRDAVAVAVERALEDQLTDGSWGYDPRAVRQGAHAGAADLTVYYHSRCLTFLFHILDCLPALEGATVDGALRRGLDFLAAVITPDGRKPLALEGKRWFWAGAAEAGSNAYDVYALIRGAQRYGVSRWLELAHRSWEQLAAHQLADGSILAGGRGGRNDFVCPTFHTADLAWPAQVLDQLMAPDPPSPPAAGGTPATGPQLLDFPAAGVVRLESPQAVALVRTRKGPRNTQFGGAIGGGTLIYVGDRTTGHNRLHLERESPEVEGSFTVYPHVSDRRAALKRLRRSDPPGREGRQWLFVARLLLAQGRPVAAVGRLWGGYFRPLLQALADPVATHWALHPAVDTEPESGRLRVTVQPARPDGTVPIWAAGVTLSRELILEGAGVRVIEHLSLGDSPDDGLAGARITYLVPAAARDLCITPDGAVVRRGPAGRRLELRSTAAGIVLRLAFTV